MCWRATGLRCVTLGAHRNSSESSRSRGSRPLKPTGTHQNMPEPAGARSLEPADAQQSPPRPSFGTYWFCETPHAICSLWRFHASQNPPEPAGTRGGTRYKSVARLQQNACWARAASPGTRRNPLRNPHFFQTSHAICPFYGATPGPYSITTRERCGGTRVGPKARLSTGWPGF